MPWNWWGGNSGSSTPTEALNPELKKFLKEQQPRPYETAEPPKPTTAPVDEAKPELKFPDTNKIDEDRPVPKESLFPDGRYAHLWKTYTPTTEITAQTLSPVDRITQGRKDRSKAIHRVALENCAFEDEIKTQCLSGVTMASRFKGTLTMCNEETKQYTRCYQLQAKFLQALGYMSNYEADDDQLERIQMHADKLYHRMMDYEADVEDAKRNNKPIPPLASIFNPNQPAPTADQMDVPEAVQARMTTPLHELAPHERELAAQAALTERNIKINDAEQFYAYSASIEEDRIRRRGWISKILGDPIANLIIPVPEQIQTNDKPAQQKKG